MKTVQCTGYINHDGKLYGPGDNLGPISDADADRLVAYGVAKVVEVEEGMPETEGTYITVAQLKEKAKELGIKDYNKMNKEQLIEAIAAADQE